MRDALNDSLSLEQLYRLERQTRDMPSAEIRARFFEACMSTDAAIFPMAGYLQAYHEHIRDLPALDTLMGNFAASQNASLLAIEPGRHRYTIWHLLLALRCVSAARQHETQLRVQLAKAWHIYDVIVSNVASMADDITDDDVLAVAERWEPEGAQFLRAEAI